MRLSSSAGVQRGGPSSSLALIQEQEAAEPEIEHGGEEQADAEQRAETAP